MGEPAPKDRLKPLRREESPHRNPTTLRCSQEET